MSTVVRSMIVIIAGLLVLSACSSGPLRTVTTGDEVVAYDFSEPATFEEGAYPEATLLISDGTYRIKLNQGDNEVWWAQWGDTLDNVVIDVTAEQISEPNENAYGLACRLRGQVGQQLAVDPTLAAIASGNPAAEVTDEPTAEMTAEATSEATEEATAEATQDATAEATAEITVEAVPPAESEAEIEAQAANGDGYLFLVRGSGSFGIFRSRGRSLTPLVNWTQSDLIHQGPAKNDLRVVCMDEYLALYINGQFAADATDSTYSAGQVGLAASAANRLGVEVDFDNLVVHKAVPG